MDPSEPGERCLPEMGLSGWMKRSMDRSYDLSDFCNSPPVDGFFYPTLQKGNNAGVAGKGNCSAELNRKDETRNCTIMGGVLSVQQPVNHHLTHGLGGDASMYHPQTIGGAINNMSGSGCNAITSERSSVPGYMKPVPGFTSSALSKQMSLGMSRQSMDSPTSSDDGREQQLTIEDNMHAWQNVDGSRHDTDLMQSHPTDDSAPTPVDHIVSNRFTPTIVTTPADEDGSLRLVEKLGALGNCSVPATPDVTPNSTPAVTPSCSPKVARRSGNPFFTGGDSEDNKSGSWLFRPGKAAVDGVQSEKLYETKVEYQQAPNSKMTKKTVRYVPRPSELRELNFWSPTSM